MLVNEIVTARAYSRKGSKAKGKIVRGHTYDYNPEQLRCGGSIPTRFQRILMPKDSVLIKTSTRFNDQYFYKSLFNKEPGPGSYKPSYSIEEGHSFSQKGYGNGFVSQSSKETAASQSSIYPDVGPGKYNVELKQTKHLATKVFAYSGRKCPEDEDVLKLNIPFDESNPLNYVKPITLNVYLKPTFPGPGDYEPIKAPQGEHNACSSVFKSSTERMVKKNGVETVPGAAQYYIKSTFDNYRRVSRKVREKRPTKKTDEYEWLGDAAEIINKSYPYKQNKEKTEIVNYNKIDQIQKIRQCKDKQSIAENEKAVTEEMQKNSIPCAAFVLDDVDRFGDPIRPKRPLDLKPGPGEYDPSKVPQNKNVTVSAFHAKSGRFSKKVQRIPGPAYYNPQKDPNKLTFHLNINRQWV